ncbi:MAG: hypothetical protein ACE5I7_11800 [Candidatus Binatia bacterium]
MGASGIEPVEAVTAGFAAHIEGLGLDVLRAELATWNGRPILRRRTCEADALPSAGDPLPLDLGVPAAQVELTDWLEGATRTADVTIIEAPSLSESVDAALLARACSGLVIVAQTAVTRRDTLELAAERARQVGCRTFGVVMYGSEKRVPAWVRHLLGGGRRQALEQ